MIEELKTITIEAGKIALEYQKKAKVSLKEDNSIVTNGDLAVSQFLETELSKFYPVLSEENYNTEIIKDSDYYFIIDPIDGTESYSKGQESWSILIALMKDTTPILGILYQPKTGKLYYAEKGKGSFLSYQNSTTKLCVNKETKIAIASPNEKGNPDYQKVLDDNKIEKIINYYSAGLKIVKIAEGTCDFYYSCAKKCSLWDLMAPKVILEEAGGFLNLKDYSINIDSPLVDTSFIASNKNITD